MSVISLSGVAVPGACEPNADIIEKLETLLDQARAGRMHGFGYVTVFNDSVGTGWGGNSSCHYMLAGATILQHRIVGDYEK